MFVSNETSFLSRTPAEGPAVLISGIATPAAMLTCGGSPEGSTWVGRETQKKERMSCRFLEREREKTQAACFLQIEEPTANKSCGVCAPTRARALLFLIKANLDLVYGRRGQQQDETTSGKHNFLVERTGNERLTARGNFVPSSSSAGLSHPCDLSIIPPLSTLRHVFFSQGRHPKIFSVRPGTTRHVEDTTTGPPNHGKWRFYERDVSAARSQHQKPPGFFRQRASNAQIFRSCEPPS